jgi:1-deoxy-D-xylulose-5-phosphate reductoisomerase
MGRSAGLAVLGSTGSIGRQTLDIVRSLAPRFRVVGLAAGRNVDLLSSQIAEFGPELVYFESAESLPGTGFSRLPIEEIASHPSVDTVVIATSGKAGLSATLAAAKAGKRIALANKEPLVMAGSLVTREARGSGAQILPVDSEHSAIWQCLAGETAAASGIVLTASGGPFRGFTADQLAAVTAERALKHPSWRMGPKVTIDSATLMNKGLEVIEARWLFDMPIDSIRVVVHPQSIIHSMVEFADGSVKAQLGFPDMRLPIQYALTYPDRVPNPELPRIDWDSLSALTFEKPDTEAFPCLGLAIAAGRAGGTQPAVLCAADEVAVDLFLEGSLCFTGIARLVGDVLADHRSVSDPSLEQILAADEWARRRALELAAQGARTA